MHQFQHKISALILFAFIAMITDVAGFFINDVETDSSHEVQIMSGCHSNASVSDENSSKPKSKNCASDNLLPCSMCAIMIAVLPPVFRDAEHVVDPSNILNLTDVLIAYDPDPPKDFLA